MVFQIPKVELKVDVFLFACAQAFEGRNRADGSFNSHLRYEPFLMSSYTAPDHLTLPLFKEEANKILHHHAKKWPQFRKSQDIHNENIAHFAHAIATIFADINHLLKIYTGQTIPNIPSQNVDYSDKYTTLAAAMEKHTKFQSQPKASEEGKTASKFSLFPISEIEEEVPAQIQPQVFACEFWDLFSSFLRTHFENYVDAFLVYASWRYKEPPAPKTVDWRVRPPVGDLFYKSFELDGARAGRPFVRGGDRDRGNDRRDRDQFKGDRDREPRAERSAPRRDNREGAAAAPVEAKVTMPMPPPPPPRASRPPKSDFHSQLGPKERPQRPQRQDPANLSPKELLADMRNRAEESENVAEFDDAVSMVEEAINKLKSNPKLLEVPLPPTNSFLRRAQHAAVVANGYDTESRGEGAGRCVFVKQKA